MMLWIPFAFSILANQSALSTSPFKLVLFRIQKKPQRLLLIVY